jgi:hypothetical protein
MLNDVYRTLNVQPIPVAFLNIQLTPGKLIECDFSFVF